MTNCNLKVMNKLFTISNLTRLAMALGLTIAISLMISPGYHIQQALYGFFDHTSRTLYESIHGQDVTRYSDLSIWLMQALDPTFLILSFMISLTAVLAHTYRNYFISLWVTTTLGLTGVDVYGMLSTSAFTPSAFTANIVANVIGGFLVAFTLTIITCVVQKNIFRFNLTLISRFTLPAISVTLFGFAVSIFLFQAIVFFFHPLPVDAKIATTFPIAGTIGTERQGDSQDSFSLVPANVELHRAELFGAPHSTFNWKKTKDDTTFSLTLVAVSGCNTSSALMAIQEHYEIISVGDITEVHISADTSMRQLSVDGEQSKVTLFGSPISIFWLDYGKVESTRSITQFLGDDTSVSVNTSGSISVMTTSALLDRMDDQSLLANRTFSVSVDGTVTKLTFSAPDNIDKDVPIKCKILSREAFNSENVTINQHVTAGILVRLERTTSPITYFNDSDGMYTISQPSGWFKVPSVELEDLSRSPSGKIGLIELRGSIDQMRINSKIRQLHKNHRFHGYGNLRASYPKDGTLSIAGRFHSAWLDNTRLNLTRWETWPIELRIALMSILIPILFAFRQIILYFLALWRDNVLLKWSV